MPLISSLIIGCVTGLIYGFFFVETRRKTLSLATAKADQRKKIIIASVIGTLARIALVIFLCFHLLQSTLINSILLLISFVGAFWLVVLKKKA